MPFILNNQNDDELKKKQVGQNISGTSTVLDSPIPNGVTPTSPKASGSFTNLQSYLDANKDQAAAMGNKIAGDVDSIANKAKTNLDNVEGSVSSVNSLSQEKLDNDFYNDPISADKTAYSSIKSGYNGPKDIAQVSGYSDAIGDWQKGVDKLKDASTEAGRQNLLKDTYNRDQYSKGSQQLDQTLIQNNKESKNAFEKLQGKWSGLNSMLDSTTEKVGNRIKDNLLADKANKDLIAQSELQVQDNLLNPIKERADKYNTETPAILDALNSGVNTNNFTQDALDRLGLTDGTNLYGARLSDYYKQDATQANVNSMANETERARYAALQNLLDGGDMAITSDGKNLNPYSIDKEALQEKIQAGKAAYENAYNNEFIGGFGPNFSTAAQLMGYANQYPNSKDTPAILAAVAAQKARYGADKIITKK